MSIEPTVSFPCHYPKVALVCEGGGMRNAYTAPVIERLVQERISVGWVGGISAGAAHIVNYLSQDVARIRRSFTDFATGPKAAGLWPLVQGHGLFDARYIYERSALPGGDFEFDWEKFNSTSTPLRIGATNARTGQGVWWSRKDLSDPLSLMVRVRASSTMPGFMPMTWIDGEPYVDGVLGPGGGLAVNIAREDGYDAIIALFTRPRSYFKQPVTNHRIIDTMFSSWPEIIEATYRRPMLYNEAKCTLLEMEEQGKAYLFFPEDMLVKSRTLNRRKLKNTYAKGEAQTEREWPQILNFLKNNIA